MLCFITWSSDQYCLCPESPRLAREWAPLFSSNFSFYRSFSKSKIGGKCCAISHSLWFFFSFSWQIHIHPQFSPIPPSDSVRLVHYCIVKVTAQCLELRNVLMSGWMDGWIDGWMNDGFLSTHRWSSKGACFHFLLTLWTSPVTLTLVVVLLS